jgi:hypothetical protein
VLGWTLFTLAMALAALNFYLSFVRKPLARLLRREYRHVSGIPGVGTFLLILAALFLFQSEVFWWGAAVVAVADTGGLPWFAGVMLWTSLRRPTPPARHADRNDRSDAAT